MSDEQEEALVMQILMDRHPVIVEMRMREAWLIVTSLQLAAQHPSVNGRGKRQLEAIARELQKAIVARHPGTEQILEEGYLPPPQRGREIDLSAMFQSPAGVERDFTMSNKNNKLPSQQLLDLYLELAAEHPLKGLPPVSLYNLAKGLDAFKEDMDAMGIEVAIEISLKPEDSGAGQ